MSAPNEDIRRLIEFNKKRKGNFIVREIGSSLEIELPRRRIRGKDFDASVKGVHLSSMMVNHVRKRVEQGLYVPKNTDNNRYVINTVVYDPVNIKKNLFEPCVAIDINACYWNTAYRLGIIDEKFYEYGLKNPDWKHGRNVAIGALGTEIRQLEYVDGEIVSDVWRRREYNVVRLDIIDYVWKVANTIINKMKSKFFMYLTDAFYVSEDKEHEVYELLAKYGYTGKSEKMVFTSIQTNENNNLDTISYDKGGKKDIFMHWSRNHLVSWRQQR